MITLTKYGANFNRLVLCLEGLSTETKPTGTFKEYDNSGKLVSEKVIDNGSFFNEIDTGKKYRYDAANSLWYETTSGGGGGGGGGTTDYTALSNKPQINSTTLTGNLSSSDIGVASATDMATEQAKTVGMTAGGSNYITVGGIPFYVSSTAPTGDILDGSIGVGW